MNNMIKADHLHKEIEVLNKVSDELTSVFEKAMLKAQTLQLKLLLNIRQNQVAWMVHNNVQLLTPKGKDGGAQKTSTQS